MYKTAARLRAMQLHSLLLVKRPAIRGWSGIFAAMKKLLFMGACLVALSASPVQAQTDVDVTVVRVTAIAPYTYVTITRPGGKQEEIEFNNYGKDTGKKQLVGVGLQQVVADLYQQGYELKSTFDTQMSASSSASVLLFIRKKQ